MQVISRRRVKNESPAVTPADASRKSARRTRKTSGTSSVDTKVDGGRDKKEKNKRSGIGEVCQWFLHLIFKASFAITIVIVFQFFMYQKIEWEQPKREDPQLRQYYGASFITKDFDCSILARRCHMEKKVLRKCFFSAFVCYSMLRPDMFPPDKKNQFYYVNIRHVFSRHVEGKKSDHFHTLHYKVKRAYFIKALHDFEEKYRVPLPNSKGMPRDNQLFFIPWEIVDRQETFGKHLDYVDLNMDDVPDCIQPKVNTDIGRRNWIRSMNWKDGYESPITRGKSSNDWERDTTRKSDRFRVDTVPGFAGALVKKIIEACAVILDREVAHASRQDHALTDELIILLYRHVLLHALRSPFLLIFNEDKWSELMPGFSPDKPMMYTDYDKMIGLSGLSSSISFLFGAHERRNEKSLDLPDTLAVTVSENKTKLAGKEFDLNVPVRIANGITNTEIVSSAQGERPFHANIIIALRIMARLRLYKDAKTADFNDLQHIPMAFYSMEKRKMVFDQYTINTPLRDKLCKKIDTCATPYDQNSVNWQKSFNGTSAILYNGKNKVIMSRIDATQDKRNYAVGY